MKRDCHVIRVLNFDRLASKIAVETSIELRSERLCHRPSPITLDVRTGRDPADQPLHQIKLRIFVRRHDLDLANARFQGWIGRRDILDVSVTCTFCALGYCQP